MNNLRFSERTATCEEIKGHLLACDCDFTPPLSERVVINDYAAKIHERAITFEAWDGGTLAGLIAAYFNYSCCFITSVSVLNTHQGRGIARQLLKRTLDQAIGDGICEVSLEVSKQAAAALRLYRSFEFSEVESTDDTLVMNCKLIDKLQDSGL